MDVFSESEPRCGAEKFIYCLVKPEGVEKSYYYISDISEIAIGDIVSIPFGSDNMTAFGRVTSVRIYSLSDAPFSPEKTKKIQSIVKSHDELIEFITVLPITHKQKTFGYINTLDDIHPGDYVEVPFRTGVRIAKVISVKKGTLQEAPANFMGSMKVIRKLCYENSDFMRFKAEMRSLAVTGELFKDDKYNHNMLLVNAGLKKAGSYTGNKKPALTEKAVSVFEKVYEVKLPSEYRSFVCGKSNGIGKILGLYVLSYLREYTTLKNRFLFDDLIKYSLESEEDMAVLEYRCENRTCRECDYKCKCPDSEFIDEAYSDNPFSNGTLQIYFYDDIEDRLIVNGEYAGYIIRFDAYTFQWRLFAKSFSEYLLKMKTASNC